MKDKPILIGPSEVYEDSGFYLLDMKKNKCSSG
jgi:hypothetical protein